MTDLPDGWRPLSAGPAAPPEPNKTLPAGTPRPVGSLLVLATLIAGGLAQNAVGWPVSSTGSPQSGRLPGPFTLLLSDHLGDLQPHAFDLLDAFAAMVQHPGLIEGVVAVFGLGLVAPTLEFLRGRAVWLELWLLGLGIVWCANRLDPFAPPGAAAVFLPLALGAAIAATVELRGTDAAKSSLPLLGWLSSAWGAVLLLFILWDRSALCAAGFAVGGVLGALPRARGARATAAGLVGLLLWCTSAGVVLHRVATSAPTWRTCDDLDAASFEEESPRARLFTIQMAIGQDCWEPALRHGLALEAAWPGLAQRANWNNNIAWSTLMLHPDDPERVAEARARAERAVAEWDPFHILHTLATAQLLQGDVANAGPIVADLTDEGLEVEAIALLCLRHLVTDHADGIESACTLLYGRDDVDEASILHLLEPRLRAVGREDILDTPPNQPIHRTELPLGGDP